MNGYVKPNQFFKNAIHKLLMFWNVFVYHLKCVTLGFFFNLLSAMFPSFLGVPNNYVLGTSLNQKGKTSAGCYHLCSVVNEFNTTSSAT